jgi:hypothetical protein
VVSGIPCGSPADGGVTPCRNQPVQRKVNRAMVAILVVARERPHDSITEDDVRGLIESPKESWYGWHHAVMSLCMVD